MEIRLAKTAGFCFGVNRAVELTYNLLNEGHKVATLGPLIHNPQAVADMERRGALVADTVDDIPTGYEVIIRSHGVPRTIYDTLEQRGLVYHDATCPFVKKIQSIAARAEAEGADLLMIDTAGRLQNRQDLMEELAKIIRVIRKKDPSAPHNTLLVLDATTGQNALSQVETFQKLADVSGLVMTKLDGTARGGVLVALADRFGLPIHAIGVGEQIDDLDAFDARDFARALVGLAAE